MTISCAQASPFWVKPLLLKKHNLPPKMEYYGIIMVGGKMASENKPTSEKTPLDYHNIIQRYNIYDDVFMNSIFMKNTPAVELVIRTILDKSDLKVKCFELQHNITNLYGHSVRLDVLATDIFGRLYNIEVQQDDRGASPRRLRYYSSLLDAGFLKKGTDYDLLPEKYIIFITAEDYFQQGEPLYSFSMRSDNNSEPLNDGQHFIYVNGANLSDTPLGKLMQDFRETDPDKMNYEELKTRAKYLKHNKKGEEYMVTVTDEVRQMGLKEGMEKEKKNSIRTLIDTLKELSLGRGVIEEKVMEKYHLSKEEAAKMVDKAWA